MNIFYFDEDPYVAAQAQPDKLLVKMPLETAQMLCTAHRVTGCEDYADEHNLYKTAYMNHPCTIWASESQANWQWLTDYGLALSAEYTERYGKVHKSQGVIEWCRDQKLYHPLLKASLVIAVTSQILEGVYVLEQPRIRNSHVQEQTHSL